MTNRPVRSRLGVCSGGLHHATIWQGSFLQSVYYPRTVVQGMKFDLVFSIVKVMLTFHFETKCAEMYFEDTTHSPLENHRKGNRSTSTINAPCQDSPSDMAEDHSGCGDR